jgi:phosphatidylglycerol:prolipoprotein diacylglycerol transferase
MLVHPAINPIAFSVPEFSLLGLHVHVQVHWYGVMYLFGFWGAWFAAVRRGKTEHAPFSRDAVSDLLFYGVLGVILGGRLGYMLFYAYDPAGHWLVAQDPTIIFRVWDGGMSFHGGLIGVLIAMGLYASLRGLTYFYVADFVAVVVPIGLFFGRIGNFINGELWGAPTTLPWGMVFQTADNQPRHPTQLYEALLEGLFMFTVLWWFGSRARPRRAISGLFLILYSLIRFGIEFVRVPDVQFGYLALGWVTMGQLLSLPMFVFGVVLMILAYTKKQF